MSRSMMVKLHHSYITLFSCGAHTCTAMWWPDIWKISFSEHYQKKIFCVAVLRRTSRTRCNFGVNTAKLYPGYEIWERYTLFEFKSLQCIYARITSYLKVEGFFLQILRKWDPEACWNRIIWWHSMANSKQTYKVFLT